MLYYDSLAPDQPLKLRVWRGNGRLLSGLEALRRLASPGGEGYDKNDDDNEFRSSLLRTG